MSEEKVRISEYGQGHLKIEGLTDEESERLKGAISGQWWAAGNGDGRLHFSPTREPVPSPAADNEMIPFWRTCASGGSSVQMELLDLERMRPVFSPSIAISGLCGYYFTPEKYKEEAAKLESWGFSCLRSRRGDDGKFWEVWYLPGLWAAKGKLNDVLCNAESDKKGVDKAVRFLSRHVSFGTLDIVVQRLAMVMDD
jgi:hypothetical protein